MDQYCYFMAPKNHGNYILNEETFSIHQLPYKLNNTTEKGFKRAEFT